MDNQLQSLKRADSSRRKKRKRLCEDPSTNFKRNRERSVKRHKVFVRDTDGHLREVTPEDTLWYQLYVAQPPKSERMLKLFRLRFRMPYSSFVKLSDEISNHPIFERWTRTDASGCNPSNIKLLLLGTMRYIGRAWTLDDIYEANGISIDVNNDFLKFFISYGSTVLYNNFSLILHT